MTMSLLMTIDSFFFLDSTSIGVYLSVSEIRGRCSQHRPDAPLLSEASPHASARTSDGRPSAKHNSAQSVRHLNGKGALRWFCKVVRANTFPGAADQRPLIFPHCKSG